MNKESSSEELAEGRTNWAHERTRLAKERTLAAWLRTGLATAGVGLALAKLLPSLQPQWLIRTLGVIFVIAGGIIFLLGFTTYHNVFKKLEKRDSRAFLPGLWGD